MPTAQPLDLPLLRQWLSTLASASADASHSRHRLFRKATKPGQSHGDEVKALNDSLAGSLGKSRTDDILRRLLALGTVQYVKTIGRIPVDTKAEDIILDVTAFALWSVAQAPVLPTDWQDTLALLTSPRMAALITRAREVDATRNPDNFVILYRALASSPVTQGARSLLEDLSDQRRGGAALASLALAADLPEPDPRHRLKTAAFWVFTALSSGALGAEGGHLADSVDRMAEDAWHWLVGEPDSHGSSVSHGGTLADELIEGIFHHH
jgi:hypothetical protein